MLAYSFLSLFPSNEEANQDKLQSFLTRGAPNMWVDFIGGYGWARTTDISIMNAAL